MLGEWKLCFFVKSLIKALTSVSDATVTHREHNEAIIGSVEVANTTNNSYNTKQLTKARCLT